jgi:hypothetical protein
MDDRKSEALSSMQFELNELEKRLISETSRKSQLEQALQVPRLNVLRKRTCMLLVA